MIQHSQPDTSLAERTAHNFDAGRLSEAESGCRRILAERPDDAGALCMLGLIAFRLGNPDAALRLIEKAIADNPVDAEAQFALGQVLMQIGRDGAAER
ncbi:MAG: tetratricopeptide repeat protein, partial [Pseudomonadota bacterium]|nr:tetratricopeptide repeat protein [Pseudomonadota bacterium]